jgi:hypothetical protein
MILEEHPMWTPVEVESAMVADATPAIVIDPGPGSPNRLLHAWPGGDGPPPVE